MDDLKINNIKKKFIDTKEKFTYLFGLLVDDNLREYTENREITSLFEIDSTLDMLNISISTVITNIEMFDNIGILSNNIMDTKDNTTPDFSTTSIDSTYDSFKKSTKSFFSNASFEKTKVNNNINLDIENNKDGHNEKENNDSDEMINYMSSFVSSLGYNKSIPKVLLPMILYTYMKLDPESIINKEQKEYNEQIPVSKEHSNDIYNYKFGKDLNNSEDEHDSDDYNSDTDTDNESITGTGVEDLD